MKQKDMPPSSTKMQEGHQAERHAPLPLFDMYATTRKRQNEVALAIL